MAKYTKRQNPKGWGDATKLVRGGLDRSLHGETSEAIYLTSGYVYDDPETAERRFAGWTMGLVNLERINPSIVLKFSEKPVPDPFSVSGRASLALLEELIATASIIGRAG